jgi:alpha-L-rhamnosidase
MTWASVLEIVGRLYGIPEYIDEAAKVRQTILKQSWTGEWFCDNAIRQKDGTLKLSGECTETCQYYAFFFRTATPQTHPELWNTLLNDFGPSRGKTGKHPKIASSNAFIGNFLRLECLSREGHSAKILEETRDFFLYMADLTGTLWENTHHHASCNHGFASHVVVFLVRDMLGLRDIDYVSKTVRFDPPKNLELNRISMRVPVSGTEAIEASWEKKPDGSIRENIVLPDGWKRK